ncbi:MAG: lipoyl synthase [Verrucomicrobiota bacterium]|jgi:lipoic acid synthetase|nr:lipoyl synthase [Verrucomicrobiota bacterium]HAY74080.1 lipoyl synthase [Opitutae bacterium]MEC7543347.1 lipoyl synthase [Verrucomicrobiota bacterium]MEC8655195.1 lipoyl synthase [Verrucomicrobiota bacterium]MED5281194.1 lipoyl synthase [Verrucomicrobiota bacterium]
MSKESSRSRKPNWLRAKLPSGPAYGEVREIVDDNQLHTVCQSAQCPNMGECWSRGTATLMILGNVCTRACTFCAVQTGKPTELDLSEPPRVADAVAKMGLRHCVLTSVARDDLKDGGAKVWAATIRAVRYRNPSTAIEVLVPDFKGNFENLDLVLDANPDIFNHNLETVERLQRPIRKTASYQRSLDVLAHSKNRGFRIKSGIMLGLGEKQEEIRQAISDLARIGLDILTLGQYLQPSSKYAPIDRWATPEEFAQWKKEAHDMGVEVVESGPLVRSSYHAEEQSARFASDKRVSA